MNNYFSIKLKSECVPLENDGIDPPAHIPETKWINVNGREEHEALLKDPEKMRSLGLDPYFETMVYLKRWGGCLKDESS